MFPGRPVGPNISERLSRDAPTLLRSCTRVDTPGIWLSGVIWKCLLKVASVRSTSPLPGRRTMSYSKTHFMGQPVCTYHPRHPSLTCRNSARPIETDKARRFPCLRCARTKRHPRQVPELPTRSRRRRREERRPERGQLAVSSARSRRGSLRPAIAPRDSGCGGLRPPRSAASGREGGSGRTCRARNRATAATCQRLLCLCALKETESRAYPDDISHKVGDGVHARRIEVEVEKFPALGGSEDNPRVVSHCLEGEQVLNVFVHIG